MIQFLDPINSVRSSLCHSKGRLSQVFFWQLWTVPCTCRTRPCRPASSRRTDFPQQPAEKLCYRVNNYDRKYELNQPNLSARRLVGMESIARQFSSSLSVFSFGHWLISGAMTLIWLQLRTSSVASSLAISEGILVILLLDSSMMLSCFKANRERGKLVRWLKDKHTSLKCFNCWKLEGIDWRRFCEALKFSSLDIFPMSSGTEVIRFLARLRFFIILKDPMFDGRLVILLLDKSRFLKFPSTYRHNLIIINQFRKYSDLK